FLYVDDNFGTERPGFVRFYIPYGIWLPSSQACILQLWDELGIPHEAKKQLHGTALPIIGFLVNTATMSATMTVESRNALVQFIRDFASENTRRTLRDFQTLAGYVNWALNVYPLLRPGLTAVYEKTKGKAQTFGKIWINKSVVTELCWLLSHLEHATGVFFFRSIYWD
ncbi:hypothetical protein CONPUDRAFT_23805, partial [Coniophora puteana RWD-64-598 SS2]